MSGRWQRRGGERGSITAFVAVVASALVMVAGMAYDGGQIIAAQAAARSDADKAARAGAQQIDTTPPSLNGETILDPGEPEAAALAFLDPLGGLWDGHRQRRKHHGHGDGHPADADPPRLGPDHRRDRDRHRNRRGTAMTSDSAAAASSRSGPPVVLFLAVLIVPPIVLPLPSAGRCPTSIPTSMPSTALLGRDQRRGHRQHPRRGRMAGMGADSAVSPDRDGRSRQGHDRVRVPTFLLVCRALPLDSSLASPCWLSTASPAVAAAAPPSLSRPFRNRHRQASDTVTRPRAPGPKPRWKRPPRPGVGSDGHRPTPRLLLGHRGAQPRGRTSLARGARPQRRQDHV